MVLWEVSGLKGDNCWVQAMEQAMSQANKGGAAPGGPSPFPNMNGGAPGFGFPPPPPGFGAAGPAGGQTFDTTAKAVGETLCTFLSVLRWPMHLRKLLNTEDLCRRCCFKSIILIAQASGVSQQPEA